MSKVLTPDICVIGAGSGGLSVAAAAAGFGVDVVLIEKGKMGGDCLNTGCVPSKALIAAAKRAHIMRSSVKFGIKPCAPEVDFARVHDHIHGVISAIAPNDSVARFTKLGVRVIEAAASFIDADTVAAGGELIRARRFVIATGSSAAAPPIPGLDKVAFYTNENLFELKTLPEHLIIIGGGPIGMEMAQAYCRLGARVSVLEMFAPLGRDDPEMSAIVLERIRAEGVEIRGGVNIRKVEKARTGVKVTIEDNGKTSLVEGSHLLIAAGRTPNTGNLGLEKAGIKHDRRGIRVDKGLRSTNRRVYAIGDVAGHLQFTHVANYHAGIVIRAIVFRLPAKISDAAIPWVTYTDPELAHVGLTEEAARKAHGDIKVLRWPFAGNDRAIAMRETSGLIKATATRGGRILGATIAGPEAGEIIQPWVLAITSRMNIKAMANTIAPYPTLSEVNKRAAIRFYHGKMGNPWLGRLIRFLARFG